MSRAALRWTVSLLLLCLPAAALAEDTPATVEVPQELIELGDNRERQLHIESLQRRCAEQVELAASLERARQVMHYLERGGLDHPDLGALSLASAMDRDPELRMQQQRQPPGEDC